MMQSDLRYAVTNPGQTLGGAERAVRGVQDKALAAIRARLLGTVKKKVGDEFDDEEDEETP